VAASRSLRLADRVARQLRRREGRNLIAVAVYGSVAQGEERRHSDLDMLLIRRRPRRLPRTAVRDGVLVTFLQMTPEAARAELSGANPNLPEALSGWRSIRALYDPTGIIGTLRRKAGRPTAAQFRKAARAAFLATYEDYGKLRNALDAGDHEEAREMAIWFTGGAMAILFCLEGYVPATGRRLFVDVGKKGSIGKAICALRYEPLSAEEIGRLAVRVWRGLLHRADVQGVRVNDLA